MRRILPLLWCGSLLIAYLAGQAGGPASAGQNPPTASQQPAPAGALPPGDYSKIQLAPDQGEPFQFSGESLRKAHVALEDRAQRSAPANAAEFMKPMVTRTHSYILLHRTVARNATQAPSAEQHEGATDVYIVVAGGGTVTVGGEIDNRRISRPGEYQGPIKGGKQFKLKAGDILNIPPNTPHATVPDPGGMTYVLQKINVGLYPWSLINGTP
jgi:mannose-6-phosphate isomerase-like protein (cupin superfamily)